VVRKPLLIAKTGDTMDSIREDYGDFDRWFARHAQSLEVKVVEVHKEPHALPAPRELAGVIITGSPHSVTEPEEWTNILTDWTVQAVDEGLPTLAVCYGHQIIGHAFGGEVIRNPVKYEIGTIEIELTEAGRQDELFGQLEPGASKLSFNAVHGDIVSRLPEGAIRLATNDVALNQAYKFRDHVWAVQFHPEFSEEIMKRYVEGRAANVNEDALRRGVNPQVALEEVARSVRETPCGPKLIQDFVRKFVVVGADD